MAHGDLGQLTAYLDEQLPADEIGSVQRHVGDCPECQRDVERLTAQKERMRAALASLDVEVVGAHAALARAAAHLRQRRTAASPPAVAGPPRARSTIRRIFASRRHLLRAAMFVLFIAGGVSALVPGSPLRRMLGGEAADAPQEVTPAIAPSSPPQAERAPELRVRAAAAGGRLRVALQMAPGSELVVSLVDGDSAAVMVPVDANVSGSDGLLEATSAGPVRVDVPRTVPEVSLEVGGQLYLRVRGGLLDVIAPTTGRSDTQASFRIP
jgi:anti-sigma factor RsiW